MKRLSGGQGDIIRVNFASENQGVMCQTPTFPLLGIYSGRRGSSGWSFKVDSCAVRKSPGNGFNMASPRKISVKLPSDKIPTKLMVRDIVAAFLPTEWPLVDPETLKVNYQAAYTNAHCIVERPRPSNKTSNEPLKVFIKFLDESRSGIDIFEDLAPGKEQETLLCREYSSSGLGAKVYGFFQTEDGMKGRIDEFLDARNLQPEDVEDAAIRADIATAFANFHAMETSLPKSSVADYYNAILSGLKNYYKLGKL